MGLKPLLIPASFTPGLKARAIDISIADFLKAPGQSISHRQTF